jgi:integrase
MPRKRKQHRGPKGEGSLFQRGRVWWYKSPTGERFSTGTQTQSEAIDFKIRKLAELRIDQPAPPATPTTATTVNALLDAHGAYMRRKNRRSTQDVEWILNKHVRPYFGDRIAATLTTADFEKYREFKKNLEPTTINRHLSYIRSGFVTGHRRVTPRMVDFIPAFPIVDESYNVRQGFLTFEGYEKVYAALPVSLKPLFCCAFHVSSRKGELQNILWSQVDLAEGLIVLDPLDTKNKKGRALPIYGDMVEVLKNQKQIRDKQFPECEHVFFWHTEDAMIANGGQRSIPGTHIKVFRKSWTKAVKAAGYPSLLFHDLRRTAERNMTKAGMDQDMRMKISGHKTPSMSTRYNIVVAADVAEERKKMDDWFKQQRIKSRTTNQRHGEKGSRESESVAC